MNKQINIYIYIIERSCVVVSSCSSYYEGAFSNIVPENIKSYSGFYVTISVPPAMLWYVYVTLSCPLPSRSIPTRVSHYIKDADRPSFKDG
jgi:hypothetical protein